jgi:hypothetical protein
MPLCCCCDRIRRPKTSRLLPTKGSPCCSRTFL